ncbi:hypothetical protein KIF24_26005 [Micromonospora sp. Llam7]|nr:hypothetical protein [Micromonospora tarapacensis]
MRRWSVGVIAATLLVPGLAACNSGGTDSPSVGSSSEAGIPADPKAALVASTKGLADGNFTFTITADSMSGKGTFHKPSNSAQMTMTMGDEEFTMDFDLIQIQPDTWVKVDLGDLFNGVPGMEAFKDKYQHLDAAKAGDAKNLDLLKGADPADAAAMFEGLTDVQKTGEGAYSGTFDLSAVQDSVAADEELLKELGDKAKAVPFTAKLDTEGRLTELVMSMPAAGDTTAQDIKVTYAEYGAATAVQAPPADQVTEASEQTYEMFK